MFITLHTSLFLFLLALYPATYLVAFVIGEASAELWEEKKKNLTVGCLLIIICTLLGGSITSLTIYLV